jgi:sialic acid synthase SpsE
MFTRSIVVKKALPAGTELRHELLALKKPGTGLPASALPGVIGRRLRRALAADALLKLDDLESS